MAAIEKTMIAMVIAIMMVLVMSQVVQAMQPAPPPPPGYCCPVPGCGLCFYTYDELYAHSTTEHPSEPIEIIWD